MCKLLLSTINKRHGIVGHAMTRMQCNDISEKKAELIDENALTGQSNNQNVSSPDLK